MHRVFLVSAIVSLVLAGAMTSLSPRTVVAGHAHALLAKKKCTIKKVHGKKKRVCRTVRAKPKPTPSPTQTPTPPAQLTSGAQVDAYLTRVHFSGYILLERHGQIILSKGYAMADTQRNVPNTIHTQWPMLGVENFMVAMAVLKLHEEGKLSVQDKLCMYIDGCPRSWKPITVEEVLLGTSGVANNDAPYFQGGSTKDTLAQCEYLPLTDVPGTVPQDEEIFGCNLLLLSLIVEKASGLPFATVMQNDVFQPAGMTDTSFATGVPQDSAKGYQSGSPTPLLHADGYPMFYSSVADIKSLDEAFLAGKIVSKQSQDTLSVPHVSDNIYSFGYGTGVVKADQFPLSTGGVSPIKTNSVVFQSTGGPDSNGFTWDNALSPDDGTIAIYFSNDTGFFDDNAFNDRVIQLLWAT